MNMYTPTRSSGEFGLESLVGLNNYRWRVSVECAQAVSLTYSTRITLTVQVTESEILLFDIGSHDEVYG